MLACLHNDKVDEADVFDNSIAKVPAEGLSNLNTIAEPEVRKLTWLHCRQHKAQLRLSPPGTKHRCGGDVMRSYAMEAL